MPASGAFSVGHLARRKLAAGIIGVGSPPAAWGPAWQPAPFHPPHLCYHGGMIMAPAASEYLSALDRAGIDHHAGVVAGAPTWHPLTGSRVALCVLTPEGDVACVLSDPAGRTVHLPAAGISPDTMIARTESWAAEACAAALRLLAEQAALQAGWRTTPAALSYEPPARYRGYPITTSLTITTIPRRAAAALHLRHDGYSAALWDSRDGRDAPTPSQIIAAAEEALR